MSGELPAKLAGFGLVWFTLLSHPASPEVCQLDCTLCPPTRPTHTAYRDSRPAWPLNLTAWEAAAGNYYPLTAAMALQDSQRQLALLTERAQGELVALGMHIWRERTLLGALMAPDLFAVFG